MNTNPSIKKKKKKQGGPAREIGKQNKKGESIPAFNNGQVLSHLDNNNGQGPPSLDHGRGLSPSDYGFLLSQVESDTRLQIAIGLRPRFVTLGLWLLAFAS